MQELKEKLVLVSYYQKDSCFYTKEHQSSSLIMKNLIEIISVLENHSINYRIDAHYNIFITEN